MMSQTSHFLSLRLLIMIPVFMVTVRTASEEPCVFPFHYKGNTYSDCTIKDESALWCATTQNYARRKWRYCEDVPRWSVTYSHTHICALEGSSVTMSCSYTYPSYLTVKEVFWTNKDPVHSDLSTNVIYKQRVTVVRKMKHMECSLNITQLTKADGQYQYYCRIITNVDKQKMTGTPGISLKITDLQIVSSSQERVKEGNRVTLTCKTTCNLPDSPAFTWSKDGRPVEEKQIIYNQLQLHPVTYKDEGSYTCAVRGHEGFPSPPMKMKVMCPTVVFSDIEDAVEGDAITLTCSTTCNLPDSPSFIWSKDGRPVEKKQINNNQLQLHPVSYKDEGSYTCAVRGHEGLPSPPYRLQVMITPSPVKSNLVIAVLVGVAVCGVVGLLFVLYWLRSHKRNSNRAQEGDQECQDDVQYSSINFQRSGGQSGAARPPSAAAAAAGGTDGDVLYANFQPRGSRQTARSQGDNVCYASIQIDTDSAGKSYPDQPEGEPSVIYSSVQKREAK